MTRGRGLIRGLAEVWGRWRRLAPAWRHFAFGLLFGLGFETVACMRHESRFVTLLEDVSLDWVMRMHAGTSPVKGRPVLPFTLFDIDDATYRVWGEPLLVPRDKLLALIRQAERHGAMAVVVDVDLSRPGDKACDTAKDDELKRYVMARATPSESPGAQGGPSLVPIVFIRAFELDTEGQRPARPRTTILDGVASKSRGLYFASPLFDRDPDFVVRRWRLWEPTCGDAVGDVVPSVQLVVLSFSARPQTWTGGLEGALVSVRDHACVHRLSTGRSSPGRKPPARFTVGRVELNVEGSDLERRVVYTIPWKLRSGQARPPIRHDGRDMPLLYSIPAHRVLDGGELLTADAVRDRVVVIGGSFAESRDIHATPLGAMPGAFVLVNAIHSILQFGELQQPTRPWKVVAMVVSAAGVALIFAWLGAFLGLLASGLVILVGLVPLSFYLFRAGVWLEFAIPLVGVALHAAIGELMHAVRRGRHGGER